jgi:hypothetical protein
MAEAALRALPKPDGNGGADRGQKIVESAADGTPVPSRPAPSMPGGPQLSFVRAANRQGRSTAAVAEQAGYAGAKTVRFGCFLIFDVRVEAIDAPHR